MQEHAGGLGRRRPRGQGPAEDGGVRKRGGPHSNALGRGVKSGVEADIVDPGTGEQSKTIRAKLRRGHDRWTHGAPLCQTCSRAKRHDQCRNAQPLRSDSTPERFAPKPEIVVQANTPARSMALQSSRGWWSVENLTESLLSEFGPLKAPRRLNGCARRHVHTKSPQRLTSAGFVEVMGLKCPKRPLTGGVLTGY